MSQKVIRDEDKKFNTLSSLNQLIDVIQEDISGSATRKKYQVFVTGGVGPGVTSSLFQTVFDQDFTLQTANAMFDMTVGLYTGSDTVQNATTDTDAATKLLFPSQTLMMREKTDIYTQYAQVLLGSRDFMFTSPFGTTNPGAGTPAAPGARIDEALFISFKRLFARDKIRPETFAMRFYQTASLRTGGEGKYAISSAQSGSATNGPFGLNHNETSISGSLIITDIGAATNTMKGTYGGDVANLVAADDTSRNVGLIFYDHGTVVLDLKKVTSGSQFFSGSVDAMSSVAPSTDLSAGQEIVGGNKGGNPNAKFIPDFLVSGSIDNILDHIATCRFQSGSLSAMTFQNVTKINSMLLFCRATAEEFNYSTNPTFTDANGRIRVIDEGVTDETQRTFSFVTTVGLYNDSNDLLAVAKLSRPVEKNDEKDVTFRVRLDF